ncbi:putative spermidine/putrescine transport system permease protein [Aquamicrobium terrae]|uniref:Spermidine/putrescine transport system permease protein n=2 Tax=Aquamicrobium terrae TaxID=1324945 RepID=A0ABV2N0D2_9HYPH
MDKISPAVERTSVERVWAISFRIICGFIFFLMLMPILIMIPLSFNAEPYFTFTPGMLALDPNAFSMRWYAQLWNEPLWREAFKNSALIGVFATSIATPIGTLAALGLARSNLPAKPLIMAVILSPMIVPIIVVAASIYFFFTMIGLAQTYTGLILVHAMLGTPLVVTTVLATLSNLDPSYARAASSLGASPMTTFRKVTLPLISPGIISGAIFAFATSLDEIVVTIFLSSVDQRTVPRQMFTGIREQISPAILAASTVLIVIAILIMIVTQSLRRR